MAFSELKAFLFHILYTEKPCMFILTELHWFFLKDSQFLLFMIIMVYKVAACTELAHTELLLVREIQDPEGRASPCSTVQHSDGNVHIEWLNYFATLHMSVNDHENALEYWFGVTNTFKQVSEFANTESANNEDWLYMFYGNYIAKI